MARRASRLLLLLLAVALVGCDHATKLAASAWLGARGSLGLVPGVLELRYAENRDTAFGFSSGIADALKQPLLVVLSLAALAGVGFWWWRRRTAPVVEQIGYAFAVAGAVGNVLDRLLRGYVVDFIHLHHWPVFNVADMLIVVGVALLGYSAFARRPPRALGGAGPGEPPA